MAEKSINLSLTRIFNFPAQNNPFQLSICFYSAHTNTLLTKKIAKPLCFNGSASLVVNLKINYTEHENQIIVMFQQLEENTEQSQEIGSVVLNLDEVEKKNIKYYPISSSDKILQVEVYEGKNSSTNEDDQNGFTSMRFRQKFISDRKKFLESILETEAKLKKKFQQKIIGLVNDAKSIKLQKQQMKSTRIIEDALSDQPSLQKCKSEQALNKLMNRNNFNHQQTPKKKYKFQSEEPYYKIDLQ